MRLRGGWRRSRCWGGRLILRGSCVVTALGFTAGPFCRLFGCLGDMPHLFDHPKQCSLVHLSSSTLAQACQRLSVFPHTDGRVRHCLIGNLDVFHPFGVEHPDSTDIARVPADDEAFETLAACDPRLEHVAEIMHVIDHESGTRQLPADYGQEIDQERCWIRGDSRVPGHFESLRSEEHT